MLKNTLKKLKSNITAILVASFGIIMLALQIPVTNALVKRSANIDAKYAPFYKIKNTYNLPESLNEISGLYWVSNNVFACIQDEDGILFIYDVSKNKIINRIKFAGSGDYEALTLNKDDAYVMRSDGVIYEIKNYVSEDREISKFETPFNEDNNIESLTLDKQNNRLLTIPKDEDLGRKHFKSIYQIPLNTKQMDSLPFVKIDLKADIFKEYRHKKIEKTFNPSDIAIHPKTKDIYILEGKKPKLLVLNSKGKVLKVHELDKRKFAQPEGIAFSEDGRLFIANEATDSKANIIEIQIKESKKSTKKN